MAGFETIRITVDGLEAELRRFEAMPQKMVRAIQMALNTVGRRARTQATREIRDEINLKPSYIREQVNYIPATAEDLRVIVYARKRGVTLSQFPNSPIWKRGKNGKRVKAGVRVYVGKGATELIEGAFIAPIGPAGGLIVQRKGQERLPIDVLHGPSPSQVMNTKLDQLGAQAEDLLVAEIERQLNRVDL